MHRAWQKGSSVLARLLVLLFMVMPTEVYAQAAPFMGPFVEPDDGRAPLSGIQPDGAFTQATQALDLYIFNLTLPADDDVVKSIRDASARGVTVRALLEPCPGEGAVCVPPNVEARAACDVLTQGGVTVQWANSAFPKTHAKSVLIDNNKALIMTLNLVPQTFTVRRDYGVLTDDPGVVENLSRVFAQDWSDDPTVDDPPITDCSQPPNRPPFPRVQDYAALVISPDINPVTGVSRAREQLVGMAEMPGLIRSAQASLKVQMEKIDPQAMRGILPALVETIERGVPVQVLLKPATPTELDNRTVARRINMAGGEARCQPHLHAKMILMDAQQVYVGSHNLTRDSLDLRREIGWITSEQATLTRFQQTFDADWPLAGSCELP